MKKLYLIRHAKASWDTSDQSDFDRPLTEQGRQDAHTMAEQLKQQKLKPDFILSSNAERAIRTAEIFAEELNYPIKNINTDSHMYMGGVEELIKLLKGINSKFKTVFLVGHNPSLTLLSHLLSEGLRLNIATSGVVSISFNMSDWKNIVETEGKFLEYIHPHLDLHEHSTDESHEQNSGSTTGGT